MADTGAEGKALFRSFVHEASRSLLCVMEAFPSARPSLGTFFASVAQRLQPRAYSISSSPAMHPTRVHVTCAVVAEPTPSGRTHQGVCSTFLKASARARSMRMQRG